MRARLTIVSLPQAAFLIPRAAPALRAGHAAQGKVRVGEQTYLYAARPVGQRAVVLLRPAAVAVVSGEAHGKDFVLVLNNEIRRAIRLGIAGPNSPQ